MAPRSQPVPENSNTKWLQLSDSKVRYQETGQGDTAIILLHGFNANLSQFDDTWLKLINFNPSIRIIRLDIPGYGASQSNSTDYSLQRQAQRIIQFMDATNLKKAVFVGISMGASLSATLGATYPERTIGAVLAAPSGYSNSLNYPGHFGPFLKPGAPNSIATLFANSPIYRWLYPQSKAIQALTLTASYGKSWENTLNKLSRPVVLLWSTGDQATPYDFSTRVNQKIKQSVLITLPIEIGHDVELCSETIASVSYMLFELSEKPDELHSQLSTVQPYKVNC
jgi:pimeloyl-ACP methyl ester carboxylesterase